MFWGFHKWKEYGKTNPRVYLYLRKKRERERDVLIYSISPSENRKKIRWILYRETKEENIIIYIYVFIRFYQFQIFSSDLRNT